MGNKTKTAIKITLSTLGYVFIVLCALLMVFTISAKKKGDDAVTVFGKQFRIILSDSMAEHSSTDVSNFEVGSLPVKTMIFIDVIPQDEAEAKLWYANLKVGDVLTFRYVYSTQVTITHRIIDIKENDAGGYDLSLEGDNKAGEHGGLVQTIDTSDDTSPNYVIGKVTGDSYILGLLVYAMRSSVGIICIIIVPSLLIIVAEVIRISNVFKKEKVAKAEAEATKRQEEIDALKQQLESLRQSVQSGVEKPAQKPVDSMAGLPDAHEDDAHENPSISERLEKTDGMKECAFSEHGIEMEEDKKETNEQ